MEYNGHRKKIELIKQGKLSLPENVNNFLKRIEDNKHLNAFNFVFEDAIETAKEVEDKIKSGTAGKAAGMVVAVKDNISIENKPLTCSSKILENFLPVYTATAVKKLIEEDAIIIGKTNCDEFAMGSSNENSAFGAVLNPYDNSRVPGGSSGGSAVAVAAGLCDTALGSDTGGSIRQPAAFCGVYGLKPTYGRVSRYGLTAFASSFDSIGPFARNIHDLTILLNIISGYDEKDSTSQKSEPVQINGTGTLAKIKIGLPKEYFGEGLNGEIRDSIEQLISKLPSEKFQFEEISLPHTEYAIATYYILTTAEASSNLARYDGVRFGYRSKEAFTLNDMYENTRTGGFGKEVKRRIMLGTYVLSSGYYDAYYLKAQKVRRLFKEDFIRAFGNVDLILTPTTPTTAFKIGEKSSDPLEMYLNDIYTTSANLAGIPALNIPIGFDKNGLPIGMQLMAAELNEQTLLNAAFQISDFLQEK